MLKILCTINYTPKHEIYLKKYIAVTLTDGVDTPQDFVYSTFAKTENTPIDKSLFECGNGELIQQIRVCDGNKECKDGSDERNCCEWHYTLVVFS